MKICFVAGTRPNFVKIAPLISAAKARGIECYLIHTGQHHDYLMSQSFFEELKIPAPDINLEINSAVPQDLKQLTSVKIAQQLEIEKPDLVVVVGDSDATAAGAMAAKKVIIKLAHVEAGLRSFFMAMPEEVNRLYIDSVADYLFVSEPSGLHNLKTSRAQGKIYFVGNVMIDTLVKNLDVIKKRELRYPKNTYGLLTLHRKSNVHEISDLAKSIEIVNLIADKYIKLVFPMHPRTRINLNESGLVLSKNIIVTEPLSYLDFQSLLYNSKFALTDSGGIQDETTFYTKPCITMRENTERPITYRIGSSVVVGLDKQQVISNVEKVLAGKYKKGRLPKYWEGNAAPRIIDIILMEYEKHNI